ncbi:NAD(P)H-dependent oxidoreductase [Parasalinivibrio latis]|uniref:NAD(P)H-dependent oxidoreductase n=1 Tax=Parasalinivibrio latis TaxID=2952610 RepID=UPI0030DE1496
MKILILNGHHYFPFAEGKLNGALVETATETLTSLGHEVRHTYIEKGYDAETEIEKHLWADVVILQTPVYWMSVTWSTKKYMDEVYTAGLGGRLCHGDGRSRYTDAQYGSGGSLEGKKYMLSLTFNAPEAAFNDQDQYLFQGKSVDDLFFPVHMAFRFFAMTGFKTFVCYDVMKNPDTDNDLIRYKAHLETLFKGE